MESLDQLILNKQLKKEKKTSERAELLRYFVDTLRNKNKKPFPARMIAIKLSHIPTKDLYYFISVCKDIDNRRGRDAMSKFFWWSLKSNTEK